MYKTMTKPNQNKKFFFDYFQVILVMFVLTNGIYKDPVYEKNNMRVRAHWRKCQSRYGSSSPMNSTFCMSVNPLGKPFLRVPVAVWFTKVMLWKKKHNSILVTQVEK